MDSHLIFKYHSSLLWCHGSFILCTTFSSEIMEMIKQIMLHNVCTEYKLDAKYLDKMWSVNHYYDSNSILFPLPWTQTSFLNSTVLAVVESDDSCLGLFVMHFSSMASLAQHPVGTGVLGDHLYDNYATLFVVQSRGLIYNHWIQTKLGLMWTQI